MLLDLIYGGIGTGKTEKCIELIEKTLAKNPGHNAILTVPDQYSYTAEKRLVERLGGTGLNGIEVLTFSQFFRRYINKDKNYLTPAGKQMLFYTAISEQNNDNIFGNSVDKPGFVTKVSELVSEMKRYLVTPENLYQAADEAEGMLSQKLKAFADIYSSYNSLIKPGFVDSEDDFLRFAEFVTDSGEFKNTHIWFDGFVDFLPQHYKVIRAFLTSAQSVHITLCLPDNKGDDGVFATPFVTCKKLKSICESTGAKLYEQYCDKNCKTIKSPEILHLIQNWDNRRNKYNSEVNDISVFCARDLYSEIENVAKNIIKEVKNGARFRDIGVMCTDINIYSHLIEALFGDYGIPYFSDVEQPITEHPIILTLLAAFDIIEENWSYESVFKYLRTGYIYVKEADEVKTIDRETVDRLENYVLRRGIRGKKAWLDKADWQVGSDGVFDEILNEETKKAFEDADEINQIRKIVCKPFEKLYNRISGKRCVRETAEALYGFLCDIHLYEGIGQEVQSLNDTGRRNEAERMKEIWNLLMEVINQAAVTVGEKMCSRQNFREMIRAGLEKAVMQTIPPGIDCVSVGAADRNSPERLDIVFFVGAVGGTMPKEANTEGILTDSERFTMNEMGIEISADTVSKANGEMYKLYRAVASASKKLYFSYPLADLQGEAKLPAAFIKDLEKMFKKLTVSDDLFAEKNEKILTAKQAFLYIMKAVSDKNKRAGAHMAAEYFKDDKELSKKLPMVRYASEYRKVQPQIKRESAKLLYNDYHRYSVSRLNDYSACPFGYFVKHGLKARERKVWQIQKFEIGSLLHWAVCEYCTEVENGAESIEETALKWKALEDEKSNQIIDKIMADISARILSRLSSNQNKVEYLLERMKKILLRSVDIVRLSLSKGEYTAVCYEQKFQIDIEWNDSVVGLNGTIDRVDALQDTEMGKIYLRVIDYKSGSKAFDVVSVSNNTDMQLVVYSIAAVELYKKGVLGRAGRGLTPAVSGILYNKLRNDIVECKGGTDNVQEIIRSNMRLDGLVVVDDDERHEVIKMDEDLKAAGARSSFMKLAVNSKGDALNKKYSSVAKREKFEILTSYVKKTVVKLDDEIFSGNIEIKPSGGKNKSACAYCGYKEICLYDAGLHGQRRQIENEDEAWKYMLEQISNDDGR